MRKQDSELQPQPLPKDQIDQTNLISCCAGVTYEGDKRKAVVVIYLEFNSGFDSDFILHDILINKSKRYRQAPRLYSKETKLKGKNKRDSIVVNLVNIFPSGH